MKESKEGGSPEMTTAARKRQQLANILASRSGATSSGLLIAKRPSDVDELPLSYAQEGIWFVEQLNPQARLYNLIMTLDFEGELDEAALGSAVKELVRRHTSLRTTFQEVDGKPTQRIEADVSTTLEFLDLVGKEGVASEAGLERILEEQRVAAFDFGLGPPVRFSLVRASDSLHVLVMCMHHILVDGWSFSILQRELEQLYHAFASGETAGLEPVLLDSADLAWWQRRWVKTEAFKRRLERCKGRLLGAAELELATDHRRPATPSFAGASEFLILDAECRRTLSAVSSGHGGTEFVTLLAIFLLLLHRYSGQTDVVIGSPVTLRSRAEIDDVVGLLINMGVLRVDLSDSPDFSTLLGRTRDAVAWALDYVDVPYEALIQALHPTREAALHPLFQVVFNFENRPSSDSQDPSTMTPGTGRSRSSVGFDLEVSCSEQSGCLQLRFDYSTDLFEAETIRRMVGHYHELLEQVVADPEGRVSEFSLVSESERQQMLVEWNATAVAYPREASIVALFEEQVERTPDALAVAYGESSLTYGELDARANRLAHHLRGVGVGPEVLVGLCVERSLEMVVGMLGILKAGGAYVPLDPEYPAQRLAFMLEDSGAPVLLVQSWLEERLPAYGGAVVRLDTDWGLIEGESSGRVESGVDGSSLAYVIYTSGSTGVPKGVCVAQRAVVRLVKSTNYLEFGPEDVFLQFAPISFDASTLELWGALLNGVKLAVYPAGPASLEDLGEAIRHHGVTVLWLTGSLFHQMVDRHLAALRGVRQLLAGGEALSVGHVRRVLAGLVEGQRLVNGYGPTEGTTFTCCHLMERGSKVGATVPIGRPIANTRVYVLDERKEPVPVGVPGELYIGGDGLARCYWNRPELTGERFVASPFDAGERLYRTGDRVRYRSDGTIEFLGRLDDQVKVRGYRIELGEVESVLRAHGGVREAAVVCREDVPGDKRLVAYVVGTTAAELSASELRAHLRERLPGYMVPSTLVVLDGLPVTANGKVDREALPAPEGERQVEEAYVAPRGALEARIAEIWREVLGVEQVGVHDNFFDLGGHSLLVLQVRARLSEALGVAVPVVTLFQHSTVASLARSFAGAFDARAGLDEARARAQRQVRGGVGAAPIAVVGMAGRFPGAADLDTFWSNLCAGVESIRFFDDEELAGAGVPKSLHEDPCYVPARGVLDDAELFDAAFFGYPPSEAELMDPQQRIFLECAWEALENAAYDPGRYPGLIGVYAGASRNSYHLQLVRDEALGDASGSVISVLASGPDFLPTRVSYKLNLHGPSVNVQTACSTSLVAVHEACRALADLQCDMALAGGVSVLAPRVGGYMYQEQGIASPDGHCRAFDADAAGTVGGEGVGIVVLKRLDEAVADGDTVHAVIRGTAINNDGSDKVGFTAPSGEWQAAAIAHAQAMAEVTPESISYVETHGTGTALGDPIEVAALTRAFGSRSSDTAPCALGALKTNIGHLDSAAGVAGLIKTVLALKHRELPPTVHFTAPNPEIDFAASRFFVNAALRPWESAPGQPRRAGVSSFGMGGTNAHAVLEEAPASTRESPTRSHQLLLLSARTPEALDAATHNLAEALRRQPEGELADVAYTLQVGRHGFAHRQLSVCRDAGEAASCLETQDPLYFFRGRTEDADRRDVVFLFTGQGSQYPNMALGLYESESVFRSEVERCCERLLPRLSCDLREVLYPGEGDLARAAGRLEQTQFTQPALFVIEYALARLWMSWGIKPAAMIGHSIGEYVAACIAGVMSLEDALELVAQRGHLMARCQPGTMLAVPLDEEELRPLLGKSMSLAAVNGPGLCVASGPVAPTAALESEVRAHGLEPQRLRTSHAFHSEMMDPVLELFGEQVSRISLNPPQIPYVSNVTGTWVEAAEVTGADYWVRHLRETVRFGAGVQTLLKMPDTVLLEVGPGQTLRSLVEQQADAGPGRVLLSSLRHRDAPREDMAFLLYTLGRLWVAGVSVDWPAFYAGERRQRVPLPTYPFERQRYWISPEKRGVAREQQASHKKPDVADWFYTPSWKQSTPLALSKPSPAETQKGCCLVFSDTLGLGAQLVERLEQLGHDTVLVTAGERFAQRDGCRYTINPRQTDDYRALLDTFRSSNRHPHIIVHLWGVESDASDILGPARFDAEQARSTYSVLNLAQSLMSQDSDDPVEILVVTAGLHNVTGEEVLRPEKATVLGPCRVIPQEYPHIACRSIDIVAPEPGTVEARRVIDELTREMDVKPGDAVVAYRGPHRWVQRFEPVRLEAATETPPRLCQEGVYLITGGLGRVGLSIAEYLARTVRAKLVLTGRAGLPPRTQWSQWLADEAGEQRKTLSLAEEADFIEQTEEQIRNALRIKGIQDYEGLEEALNDLCSSYVFDYLKRHGIDVTKGTVHGIVDLQRTLRIAPRFDKLYRCMMRMLAEDEIVRAKDDTIEFLRDAHAVRRPADLRQEVEARYPQSNRLLSLLDHCAAHYGEALTGEIDAISVLFPDGRSRPQKKSENDTTDHSHAAIYLNLLKEVVCSIVERSKGKTVRILEVGAGQGQLTDLVAPELRHKNVEYYFTDIGRTFVLDAERRAMARCLDFMKFGTLDISRDPHLQGFESNSFDMILGLNVVHATKDIEETLGHLKSILVPTGMMLLVEAVRSERWIDMTTGLAEGWWHFDDRIRRDSPLLGLAEWEDIFEGLGFHACAFPQSEAQRSRIDHGLIVAQQGFAIRAMEPSAATAPDESDAERRTRRAIRKIQQMEALGAEVLVLEADVADRVQMQRVVDEVGERFGAINGVIHGAGRTDPAAFAPIEDTSIAQFEMHFRPKVQGLYVLDRLFRGKALDFRILLSSNVSLLGGLRSVAYTSANLFLDAFAQQQNRGSALPWTSTNWDRWGYVEELLEEQGVNASNSVVALAMTLDEAVEAFERVLSAGPVPQVIVSTGDLATRQSEWTERERLRDTEPPAQEPTSLLHVRPALKASYAEPRNEREQTLADIWGQTLGIELVGIHDNYFELGGDSIMSLRIINKARQEGFRLTTHQFFEHQTIAELAAVAGASEVVAAEQGQVTGPVPLTPIQHWFFEQRFPDPHHFNLVLTLELLESLESLEPLDAARLEAAMHHLVAHHDALRLRYREEASGWVQENVGPGETVSFACVDLSAMSASEQEAAMAQGAAALNARLHLSTGPLVALALFTCGAGQRSRVLIAVHHLVMDAVSCHILLADLQTAYEQLGRGKAIALPPKTTAFGHWAQQLVQHAQSDALGVEVGHWCAPSWSQVGSLPLDFPEGINTVASARQLSISLSSEETRALLQDVPKAYNTQITDVLLAALAQALTSWTGARTHSIALEGHGREPILEGVDLSRTVGWFTTLYPVRLDLAAAAGPAEALKTIKEQVRRIPNGGIGYGLLRYLRDDQEIRARLQMLPQPEVSFTYLGQLDQSLPEDSPFRLESFGLSGNAGSGRRRHLLDINGLVIGDCLQMDWVYSEQMHRASTIEALVDALVVALRALIAHCGARESVVPALSDFTGATLDDDDLKKIIRSIDGA